MNAWQGMDRYWKDVIKVSTRKHDLKVQYLCDKNPKLRSAAWKQYFRTAKKKLGNFLYMLTL